MHGRARSQLPGVLAWLANMIQVSRLDAKIERLSGKVNRNAEQQHKDALTLQGYMIPLHEGMAIL